MTTDPHQSPDQGPSDQPTGAESPRRRESSADPLRMSRTSGAWIAASLLAILLILLIIFIVQNTQKVHVSFLGWDGQAPLAAALLIAAVAGLVTTGTAGALRILQLRRRVKRGQRRDPA